MKTICAAFAPCSRKAAWCCPEWTIANDASDRSRLIHETLIH